MITNLYALTDQCLVFLTLELISSLPYTLKIDREVAIVKRELPNALPFYYSLR